MRYSPLPALNSLTAAATSPVITVPALGVGIRPRGPSTLPSRLTRPIMSWVASDTSKSSQPSWIFLIKSSLPAALAPASLALATLSPWQKTTTRTDLPMPCGSGTVPRTIWSLCVVSMPSHMWISTVSSNLARLNFLRRPTAR